MFCHLGGCALTPAVCRRDMVLSHSHQRNLRLCSSPRSPGLSWVISLHGWNATGSWVRQFFASLDASSLSCCDLCVCSVKESSLRGCTFLTKEGVHICIARCTKMTTSVFFSLFYATQFKCEKSHNSFSFPFSVPIQILCAPFYIRSPRLIPQL